MGERFFDRSDMGRGSAFAFPGGAQDVNSPDPEAAGNQGYRVFPMPTMLAPGQKVGLSRGDFHPELRDAARTGRVDSDDSPYGSNLCDPADAVPGGGSDG